MSASNTALHDRLTRIAETLDRLRRDGWEVHRHQFRVEAHRFRTGSPLSEAGVQAFERQHGVRLPDDYRAFLHHVGEGGAGPYYGLLPLSRWADLAESQDDHLRLPSPLVPGIAYSPGWEELLAIADDPYRGILPIAEQGCGGYCAMIVSGEARGRLVYVGDGPPYFVRDRSFIDWYERWLEELRDGVDVSQFGYARGGTEAELIEAFRSASVLQDRAEILASLGRRSPLTERSHPVLIEALGAAEPEVRATALHVLARVADTLSSAIVEKLSDPDAHVREAAVHALVARDRVEPFVRELNEALARETDASALFSICHALQKVGGIRLASLRPHVDSGDVCRRRYAAHFFSETAAVEGVEGFERLLTDEDEHVRIYAREGFSKRGVRGLPREQPPTALRPRSWWSKWFGGRG